MRIISVGGPGLDEDEHAQLTQNETGTRLGPQRGSSTARFFLSEWDREGIRGA